MLRYGVIVTGTAIKAWQLECARELQQTRLAELRCVAVVRAPSPSKRDAFRANLGFPSQAPVSIDELRSDGEQEVVRVECSLPLAQDVKARVRSLGLDFLLLFGDKESGIDLAGEAKYGVWHFAHSDVTRFSSSAPCFWEIYHDHDVTGAMLLRLRDSQTAGVVLKSGYLPTIRSSLRRNTEAAFSALRMWPAHVCWDITHGAAGYFEDEPLPLAPVQYESPSAIQMAALRFIESKHRALEYVRMNCCSIEWTVGRLNGRPADFIGRDSRADVSYLYDRRADRYFADPCVLVRDSRAYLFCEEYRYRNNRGLLVASELSSLGATRPRAIIEEQHHLSYPHVFEHDGDVFCIPESGGIGKVCLYRAVEFPYRWEYVQTLIDDFEAADSTILQYGGKWWLFCTSSELAAKGYYSHLYIWHAGELRGNWMPHARNPVKIDARSARPAGQFFTHEGALYRPAQDCSRKYGGAIRINRVENLTETDFKESLAGMIRPPERAYTQGIHTISAAGDYCIVDAQRYAFSAVNTLWTMKQAVKRLALKLGVPEETLQAMKRRSEDREANAE